MIPPSFCLFNVPMKFFLNWPPKCIHHHSLSLSLSLSQVRSFIFWKCSFYSCCKFAEWIIANPIWVLSSRDTHSVPSGGESRLFCGEARPTLQKEIKKKKKFQNKNKKKSIFSSICVDRILNGKTNQEQELFLLLLLMLLFFLATNRQNCMPKEISSWNKNTIYWLCSGT